jgi:hypothetical protein
VAGLGAVPNGAIVVASPLETDTAPLGGRENELPLRVADLVAGRLTGAHAAPRTATLEQARVLASRASALVYIHLQLFKSQLRLTADMYPVIHNAWDRVRLPAPPPTGHAYAAAPIDAEVRSFFPPLPLELTTVHKAAHSEGDVLAVACGDLDGDGGSELMLVSRDRVAVGRVRASRFEVERSAAWATLGKRNPVPLREPLAGAVIDVGRAWVGTSDRDGVVLDATLGVTAPKTTGVPIGAGLCAPISVSRLAFEGTVLPCEPAEPHVSLPAFDAASAFALVAPNGASSVATATREAGKLHVRVAGTPRASFDSAGAQVALFDANLDGDPEVAFSSDAADDSITIATVHEQTSRVVNRIAAPGGVRALGACTDALVAVVGNEVWLVR